MTKQRRRKRDRPMGLDEMVIGFEDQTSVVVDRRGLPVLQTKAMPILASTSIHPPLGATHPSIKQGAQSSEEHSLPTYEQDWGEGLDSGCPPKAAKAGLAAAVQTKPDGAVKIAAAPSFFAGGV
ncbi:hypothetical protein C0991_011050 [Blastosporella zonata]|nr:hypothetical protein C0991_011050 [Blastosporella zonata]